MSGPYLEANESGHIIYLISLRLNSLSIIIPTESNMGNISIILVFSMQVKPA
jgi:hypothetical protein